MNTLSVIEIGTLITIVSVGLSMATFYLARKSENKKSGVNEGELISDVKYIKKTMDKLSEMLEWRGSVDKHLEVIDKQLDSQERKLEAHTAEFHLLTKLDK